MMKKLIVAVIIAASLMMFSSTTWAAAGVDISYLETDMGNGNWLYNYSILNTSTAGYNMIGMTLYFVDANGNPRVTEYSALNVPSNWLNGISEPTTEAAVIMSPEAATDLTPGNGLFNYKFIVDYRAGDVDFAGDFIDPQDRFSFVSGTTSGTTAPPPVAPEPISSVLFLVGVATLGVRGYLRNK